MSRTIPFGNIPDTTIFPDGIFRLKITKAESAITKEREGKAQKLMYRLTSQVVEPASHKGLLFFENFVIGTEDDADAELLETWQTSIGGRAFKRLSKVLAVPTGDEADEESYLASIKGQEYLATIVQKVDDGSKDPKYKGQVRNNATAYWKLGEKDAALTNGQSGQQKSAPRAAKPAGGEAKAAPTEDVTCTACRKRVPRKDLKAHVEAHMAELASSGDEATE